MGNIILVIVAVAAITVAVIAALNARRTATAKGAVERVLAATSAECDAVKSRNQELSTELQNARQQSENDRRREIELSAEISRLKEKISLDDEERGRHEQATEERFKVLASEILTANSRALKEQNEQRLGEILSPLKDNLEQFRKAVTDAYSNEARERFSLSQKIKELVDLNNSIGREAKELTRALRGNSKIQGDWGEMILESILEKSGLRKGIEYETQLTTDDDGHTLKNEEGRLLRPDVVIRYPDGRAMVIDSKVSLTAYVDLVNCADDERPNHERRLLLSVKAHIKELAEKRYQDYVGTDKADFVMMFIPNEGAYMAAMQLDNNLWQEAYDRRVLIVSPTHLISVIRLVEQLWRTDRMTRNVMEIAEEGGKMYDKLVAFVDDMNKIDKAITSTRQAYDNALKKLSDGNGNLIRRAEKMRALGAKASKSLPTSLIEE